MTSDPLKVWNWRMLVLEHGPDSATRRHILLTLSCYMSDAGDSCFPSIETLIEATALGRTAVIKHLKKADDEGWIERSEHGYRGQKWRRKEYRATIPEKVVHEVNHGGEEGGSPNEKGGSPNEQKVVHEVNSTSSGNNSTCKGTKESPPSAEAADSSSDPPEDEDEDDPSPEEQVEYEWTLEYSRAAMQHLRDHDLLAPVTEKKIDREGEDAVAVAWADTFRLIHEQDGYSPDEIRQTMEWLFEGGNFWIDKAAIRSLPPLRSKTREGDQYKFDAMHAQAKREGHVRRNGDGSEHPWPENPSEEWCRNNPAKNFERLRHHAERA